MWIPDESQFQESGTSGDISAIQLNDPLTNNYNVTPFPIIDALAGFYPSSGDYWVPNHYEIYVFRSQWLSMLQNQKEAGCGNYYCGSV